MREIKFRGKRIDNGEWVYGYLLEKYTKVDSIPRFAIDECWSFEDDEWTSLCVYEVNPATVGQFTGLKDKNGREIYEGDILEEGPGYYFEVVWSNEWAKFKLQWRTKGYQYPEWNRGVEMAVIGNIHDNPELLGVTE